MLLHTAGKFHGVAGAATALMLAMVVSGFVGRFLYTSVPRALDGQELGLEKLVNRFVAVESQIRSLGEQLSGEVRTLLSCTPPRAVWHLPLSRRWLAWRHQRELCQRLSLQGDLDAAFRNDLAGLLASRHELQLEIQSLAVTRRWLSLWHMFHVPLGVVLFTVVLVHVVAALYYLPAKT